MTSLPILQRAHKTRLGTRHIRGECKMNPSRKKALLALQTLRRSRGNPQEWKLARKPSEQTNKDRANESSRGFRQTLEKRENGPTRSVYKTCSRTRQGRRQNPYRLDVRRRGKPRRGNSTEWTAFGPIMTQPFRKKRQKHKKRLDTDAEKSIIGILTS